MSISPGTTLSGRYRLESRIAAGGMSTVYRAVDEVLERQVAVKLMNREVASDSDQLERFRREARAVAQLSHPHVVGVIDAGEDDARPYIVFEFVDGETLKEKIRRDGPLPIVEAIAYAIEIARALGAAHEQHIVHRDVKPQNVLIDADGSAKVTDFGIARTLEEDGLTADGRVLGTTDYVSPEQALGRPVTGQSDLYSLGVVLYEMLTGEVPFTGENQVAVAMKHVRDGLPDVAERRPEISAALASVVDTATAKRTGERYADDRELIADLEEVLRLETARAGSAGREATSVLRTLPASTQRRLPLRQRYSALAGGLGLVAVAVVAAVVILFLVGNAHHGTIGVSEQSQGHVLRPVNLCANCAHDYNPDAPFGPKDQHSSTVGLAIDGDPNTDWTTESYLDGNLGKLGVGLYVDAKPGVTARSMQLVTSLPGYAVTIYASRVTPDPDTFVTGANGWTRVGAAPRVAPTQKIALTTRGAPYRYYLVWITSLGGRTQAAINEVGLFR